MPPPDYPNVNEPSQSLQSAILRGDVAQTVEAIEAGADVNHECDVIGANKTTPLNLAAGSSRRVNQLALIEVLVGAGADVNGVDTRGVSPLVSAASGQAWDCVVALLVHGAEPRGLESNLIAPVFFPERARRPEFQQVADRLKHVCGSEGLQYHCPPGALAFVVASGPSRARQIQSEVYSATTDAGSLLLDSMSSDQRGHFLYLFPDADKLAAMSAIGVNDWPDGYGPAGLLSGFHALDDELPFSLVACSQKAIELRFESKPTDNAVIVQRLDTIFDKRKRAGDIAPLLHAETRGQNTLLHWVWDG